MSRSAESFSIPLIQFRRTRAEKSATRIVELPSSDTSDKEFDKEVKDEHGIFLEEQDGSVVKEASVVGPSRLLLAPILVRENVYRFLSQRERLTLRRVCSQLRDELCISGKYNVSFRKPLTSPTTPVPFPHLKLLTIDNQFDDLPWFGLDPRIHKTGRSVYTSVGSEPSCRGTVDELKLLSINQSTLNQEWGHMVKDKQSDRYTSNWTLMIKDSCGLVAIIGTDVFERKIPTLQWHNLTHLRINFYVVRFVGTHELEMLENFDSLCRQKFRSLYSLQICLRRSYLNPQSSFSMRALRFMSRHWETLKDASIEMEAERCDMYPQTMTPEFTDDELADLAKVQLQSLKIDATELLCRKCRTWQTLIRQQKGLESLKLSIYAAEGHPVFFYPINRDSSRKNMKTLSVGFWGLHSHYPIDFRRLTNGIDQIYNIRLFRSPIAGNTALQLGPEILNMGHLPSKIVTLTIKGFNLLSSDVDTLLRNTPNLCHLTLKNCGGSETMGMQILHLTLIHVHPSLATGCIDVVNPITCPGESYDLFMRELESGRMEFKVIASREGAHTFLLVDRARAAQIMRQKVKLYDEEVLPGLDYPTGFINRFDNWKIRA